MLGGAQTSGLPLRDLRFVPNARQGVYKISPDGAPTLGAPESVWLANNLFPLLTVVLEKSTAERCWMAALAGYCRRDACRGQCPKYKQTLECIGAFGLASLSFMMCVFVPGRASGALKTNKKKSAHQFKPSCFTGATGQVHTWRSGSAGFLYTGQSMSSQ